MSHLPTTEWDVGTRIAVRAFFADNDGTPTNPNGGVIFQVRKPDGTAVVYPDSASEVDNPQVGEYRLLLLLDSYKRWYWYVYSLGNIQQSQQGTLQVRENVLPYPAPP